MRLFTLALILPTLVSTYEIPSIYGGSCQAFPSQNSLYYMGGLTSKTSQTINHSILKLDYTQITLSPDSTADWKIVLKDTVGSAFANLVASDEKLIYYGGQGVFINESMYSYNPIKNEVTLDRVGSEFPGTTLNFDSSLKSKPTDPVDYYSTFLNINPKGDKVNDKFLLFGGIISTEDLKTPHYGAGKISVYNSKLSSWNLHHLNSSQGLNIYDHAATYDLNRNMMYVLGGKMYSGAYLPMNLVFVYDVQGDSWSVKHTVGNPPSSRIGLTSLLVNDQLVVTGGSDNDELTNLSQGVYILDLRTFTWNQLDIKGFQQVGYRACASIVGKDVSNGDGVLIYAFGLNSDFKPTTQLLNAKDLQRSTSYTLNSSKPSRWISIVISILAILIGLILLYVLYRFVYLKRKQRKFNNKSSGVDGDGLIENRGVKLNNLDRITYRFNNNNQNDNYDNLQFVENEHLVENRKSDFIK